MALGIRLAARGIFNMPTEELRNILNAKLPAGADRLFSSHAVWPLFCQRLRTAHGLAAEFSADARWLVLVCTFDEFQLIARDMQQDLGHTEAAARFFCKRFWRHLAYLVLTEGGDTSPAAMHGVCFVPMLLGTCLSGLEDYDASSVIWHREPLEPLSFADSRLVFERQALQKLRWAGPRERSEEFFHRLAETDQVLFTLKLAAGIPALITTAAAVCHLNAVACMSNHLLQFSACEVPH